MAKLTEADRAVIENVALKRLLNGFLGFRISRTQKEPAFEAMKAKSIEVLKKIAEQKRAAYIGKDDPCERQYGFIRAQYRLWFGRAEEPCIIIERPGRRIWEAFIDGHDEDIGIGSGPTPQSAMGSLLGKLKHYSYLQRQAGVEPRLK
jgi:hypothetical protein